MKILLFILLISITNVFSQKLWELELDQNITQVDLMPDNEHFIVVYGSNVEKRRLSDGSFVKEILSEEFKNNYLSSNEFYFTSDFKYFMMKWSNVLFDTETLQPVRKFEATISWSGELIKKIEKVQFSKDNKYVFMLAESEFEGEVDSPYFKNARSLVSVFDFQTGELIKKILIPYWTRNIEISEDGKYLKTFDGTYLYGEFAGEQIPINIINVESLELIIKASNNESRVYGSIVNNKNSAFLFNNNSDCQLYNLLDGSLIKEFDFSKDIGSKYGSIISSKNGDKLFNYNYFGIHIYEYPSLNLIDYKNSSEVYTAFIKLSNDDKYSLNIDFSYHNILMCFNLEYLSVENNSIENIYFTKTNATISFKVQDFIGRTANIEIFNSAGVNVSTLYKGILNQQYYNFQIPELPSGTYYLQCQLPNNNLNFNFVVVR